MVRSKEMGAELQVREEIVMRGIWYWERRLLKKEEIWRWKLRFGGPGTDGSKLRIVLGTGYNDIPSLYLTCFYTPFSPASLCTDTIFMCYYLCAVKFCTFGFSCWIFSHWMTRRKTVRKLLRTRLWHQVLSQWRQCWKHCQICGRKSNMKKSMTSQILWTVCVNELQFQLPAL